MKCKKCHKEMKGCGYKGHNFRYECYDCNLRFVPLKERWFGNNFLGYPKWSEINNDEWENGEE